MFRVENEHNSKELCQQNNTGVNEPNTGLTAESK